MTSSSKSTWQRCFVDPWRGIAHFDGITIEADPITSARLNRVLPCIEDEQVVFCRLVEALVGKKENGKFAIDLGTGSGVFALHAASRLGLRVLGIDRCKRAIAFAEYNKDKNKPLLGAGGGSVDFEHDSYREEKWIAKYRGKADYVFLNAPFSPSLPGWSLPQCANGGKDGQEAFHSALSTGYELLNADGRLFAIQLLQTDTEGNPLIGSEPGRLSWSPVRIFPILFERPIPVAQFLANESRGQTHRHEDSSVFSVATCFSLCIAEFRKSNVGSSNTPSLVPREELPIDCIPEWTWDERIAWQRAVLANTSPVVHEQPEMPEHLALGKSALPSIALFLDRSHSPLDRSEDQHRDPALSKTQAILERWIHLNGLLSSVRKCEHSKTPFDCIMVESAPWHPAQRRLDLRTETAIWSRSESLPKKSVGSDLEAPVAKALVRILNEIEHINKKKRSVFRHPALEEGVKHRLWQTAILSVFSENEPEIIAEIERNGDLDGPQEKCLSIKTEARINKSRDAATYLHPLKDFKIGERNPSKLPLEICIDAALHAYTGICRQEGLLGHGTATCYFCALPLPSPQPLSPVGTSGTLYVYGWSTLPRSPDAEAAIVDLARAGGALYDEVYSEEAKIEIGKLERKRLIESAAHEITKLCYKIQPGLSWDFANYIRDFLNLSLQIQPLGDAFSTSFNLLPSNPVEAISGLCEAAYIFQILAPQEWNAEQLTIDLLRGWREYSRKHIRVTIESSPSGLASIKASSKEAFHFVSAFVAGVRNAIKHTQGSAGSISVLVHSDHAAILNSYESDSNDEADFSRFTQKQERVGGPNPESSGSEQVIQYHIGLYTRHRTIQDGATFIRKVSCEEGPPGTYRHSWKTIIPFP